MVKFAPLHDARFTLIECASCHWHAPENLLSYLATCFVEFVRRMRFLFTINTPPPFSKPYEGTKSIAQLECFDLLQGMVIAPSHLYQYDLSRKMNSNLLNFDIFRFTSSELFNFCPKFVVKVLAHHEIATGISFINEQVHTQSSKDNFVLWIILFMMIQDNVPLIPWGNINSFSMNSTGRFEVNLEIIEKEINISELFQENLVPN